MLLVGPDRYAAYDNVVHHNDVEGASRDGIAVVPTAFDNKIHHNEVHVSSSDIDIHLTSFADYNIVHHNVMDNPVVDEGTGNKVFRNSPPS